MAKDKLQQKSLSIFGFQKSATRERAMMSDANLNQKSQLLSCKEVFQKATQLDYLQIIKIDGELKTKYEHLGGKKS